MQKSVLLAVIVGKRKYKAGNIQFVICFSSLTSTYIFENLWNCLYVKCCLTVSSLNHQDCWVCEGQSLKTDMAHSKMPQDSLLYLTFRRGKSHHIYLSQKRIYGDLYFHNKVSSSKEFLTMFYVCRTLTYHFVI